MPSEKSSESEPIVPSSSSPRICRRTDRPSENCAELRQNCARIARHLRLFQEFVVFHHAVDLDLELRTPRGERRDELRHLRQLLDVLRLLAEL